MKVINHSAVNNHLLNNNNEITPIEDKKNNFNLVLELSDEDLDLIETVKQIVLIVEKVKTDNKPIYPRAAIGIPEVSIKEVNTQ